MTEFANDIALVRMQPGMSIGSADGDGVLYRVLEVVANACDQHFARRCSMIDVEIAASGTITIVDDGPGIPAHGATARRRSTYC